MAVLPSAMRMGRIDRRTASRKAGAGVLHQMPTIDNLHGLGCCSRCSLAASATAVARDDADFRLARQPVLDCGGLAVWGPGDDAAPLEGAGEGPLTLSP